MLRKNDLLDTALLQLGPDDVWAVRDSFTHKIIFGTTGSGKSSSTIKNDILAMASAGYGALLCTTKQEDADDYIRYIRQSGRTKSLLNWRPGAYHFNPIAWLLASSGNINNVVDLFVDCTTIIRNSGSSPGHVGDEFWTGSMRTQYTHTVPVIFAATGTVRIGDVLAFIRSAPNSPEQMKDPEWQEGSAFFRFFRMAADRLERGPVPGFDDAAAQRAIEYWRSFSRLDAKTSGNIRITVETTLSRFEQGLLAELIGEDCDIFPELMFSGALILLNFPVQIYGEDAAIAQKIIKMMAQRACLLRRSLGRRQYERPVAFIVDECQSLLHNDADFLARCRSSFVACIYATQSLPTLYAKIGGDHPHDRAEHFCSNFNTIVLHSSSCSVTNSWFSAKIGKALQRRDNFSESQGSGTNWSQSMGESTQWGGSSQHGGSTSSDGKGGGSSGSTWSNGSSWGGGGNVGRSVGTSTNSNVSHGYTLAMENILEAGEFGRSLRTGGPRNRGTVDSYWYMAGRCSASSGLNVIRVEARQ